MQVKFKVKSSFYFFLICKTYKLIREMKVTLLSQNFTSVTLKCNWSVTDAH